MVGGKKCLVEEYPGRSLCHKTNGEHEIKYMQIQYADALYVMKMPSMMKREDETTRNTRDEQT